MKKLRPSGLKWLRLILAALAMLQFTAQPVLAQGILRDAETEALFADMARPLIKAAGLEPKNVQIILLQDKEINAFVAGGQAVYIHSGLINAASNANEVQGVIAHELGHVTGGHVITNAEGAKSATGIILLSLLLGAAAIAAGGGDAGAGILAAGQQAALGKYLAFNRIQEASADEAGIKYLVGAGVTGRGMVSFFKKLQNQEFRLALPRDEYTQTHPLTGDRIAVVQDKLQNAPSWNVRADPAIEARFQLVKAKLSGFVNDPDHTLVQYPESDQSLPGHYARAYAWHRSAYPDKALAESDFLLKAAPHNPYFQELKGQILLESGKPLVALPLLREAVATTNAQPLIATTFGHALIATEDPSNFAEARRVLKAAVARDYDNPFAWYQLGVVYDHDGDQPRALLATAERYNLEGRARLALASAEGAMKGLPKGSPDWIRAEDIALVAKVEADKDKKKRR
jgi:predicted Zn-dependent protease